MLIACVPLALAPACGGTTGQRPAPNAQRPATHLVLITIDTLRADRVGAYGYAGARTPVIDALARDGARFDQAFAPAPITLPSHASLLTGRYPAGHGARHNGLRVGDDVPTLATILGASGFATGAFVSAFPLDRRFGLARGFDMYDDHTPRGADGRAANERRGGETVAVALAWLQSITQSTTPDRQPPTAWSRASEASRGADGRVFLWLHLFEPHAPYEGDPARPAMARYDDEVARADLLVGRLLQGLGAARDDALIIVAGDHGEAFGEHEETGHSIFVYDTTLRVPLVMNGPGLRPGTVVHDPVSLVDLVPTVLARLGIAARGDPDGVDLAPALAGGTLGARAIFAESFAPLVDFGWAPLRAVRTEGWKYIAAPRPELYDVAQDPGEGRNRAGEEPTRAAALAARADRYSPPALGPAAAATDADAANRLRALGYASGGAAAEAGSRPDPKDRIAVASALAAVTSGEAQGVAAERLLDRVLREDPANPVAHVRLAFLLQQRGRCDLAVPHFERAVSARFPSADPALGLAQCRQARGDVAGALRALDAARTAEPDNPVVEANAGLLHLTIGRTPEAIAELREAVRLDPEFLEARFHLVRALARSGDRAAAKTEVNALLARLPADAPQRHEVERLRAALQ